MTRKHRLVLAMAVLTALAAIAAVPSVRATDEGQITPDITKLVYVGVGAIKPGQPLLAPTDLGKLPGRTPDGRFNPSGVYHPYDTNVFEVMALPYRAAGDQFSDDPEGNGGNPVHGFCGGDPRSNRERPGELAEVAGECPNHQLEYIAYYENTMRDILGDFGVTFHRYRFENPGSSNTQSGAAYNPAAIVPGATHPEETVIIGAHYDQTNDGPASAWDSQEGHAQVIRVAKLMADYWRSTGSRPAVTVKFIPWDGEESGTLGSADYADNNIVPGQESKVRGYWNTDPCAGGYPAFRFGNPLDRVDLGIQLANATPSADPLTLDDTMPPEGSGARFTPFNKRAKEVVEQVFDHLDDTLKVAGVDREIFVSTAEAQNDPVKYPLGPDIGNDVVIGTSRPVLFSSDWRNFERKGIPFFNPGPEVTGPSSQLEPGNPDGLAILHNPLDNLRTLNAYTGGLPETHAEGWIKGMEMCAHLLAWGMLQPEQAGATLVKDDVLAYYEALPNEATVARPVRFDAAGSHQRVGGLPTMDGLDYRWDFGDGSQGKGRTVEHAYAKKGVYTSKLTVRDPGSGKSDTMTIPITVVQGVEDLAGPQLSAPAEDQDGTFPLSWTYGRPGVEAYAVEEGADPLAVFSHNADAIAPDWEVEDPNDPKIRRWQVSDSGTSKVRGNLFRSGPRSFWTGVASEDQQPGVGPAQGTSSLTSKSVALPARKNVLLSYWSDFANDANDFARVEAAVDDGSGHLDWETVDSFGRNSKDEYTLSFTEMATEAGPRFERRTIDLSRYAGNNVRLRFTYSLGAPQFVNVWRTGWYVDDISLVTADFREIGRTTKTSFDVTGRKAGTYLYRVRALFPSGSPSGFSNPEQVRVTVGRNG